MKIFFKIDWSWALVLQMIINNNWLLKVISGTFFSVQTIWKCNAIAISSASVFIHVLVSVLIWYKCTHTSNDSHWWCQKAHGQMFYPHAPSSQNVLYKFASFHQWLFELPLLRLDLSCRLTIVMQCLMCTIDMDKIC